MSGRWLRVGALGMAVVLAGCAAAPPKPVLQAFEPELQAPVECATLPPSWDAGGRLARAVAAGTLGVLLSAVQGAGQGASWAWVTGGSASEAAWIGAAAGAGVGLVVGFVAGLAKAGTYWSPEPATSPACPATLAEATE